MRSVEIADDCVAKFKTLVELGTNVPDYRSW